MTQPIPRVLIQETLANDRLPRAQVSRIWGGQRSGETCDGGEATVRRTHPAMSKGLARGLAVATFAALSAMSCVASAGVATKITSCGTLDTFGGTYVLTANLTSCDTCLVVANNRITIDLAGYTISGSCKARDCAGDDVLCQGPRAGVTEGGTPWLGTTVKNGTITGFDVGIDLALSTQNVIRGLTSSANSADGIMVGNHSLVKDSLIEGNGQDGIFITDFGQVEDCTIGGPTEAYPTAQGNKGFGISGFSRLLIRNNMVVGNQTGIFVGDFSTVSFNTASGNSTTGVYAGIHSLVTSNETTGNGNGDIGGDGGAGIIAGGLSTVSYNISSGNVGGGIAVTNDEFGDGTRSLVTGNITNSNGNAGVEAWCPSTVTNNQSSGNGGNIANRSLVTDSMNYDYNGPPEACRTKNNK